MIAPAPNPANSRRSTQPRIRLQRLQRAKTAIAHSAQIELANLKRMYKAQGFSEADIHSVIPDRPRPKRTPVTPPSPTPAGPTQPAPEPAN